MSELSNYIMSSSIGKTYLFSTGQAGFIIKSASGQMLAIDLYLSDCVERDEGHVGFKRMLPKLLKPQDLILDVVIATHPHLDHFDMDTIPELMSNGNTKLYCSVDCEKLVNRTELEYFNSNITYVKPGDNYKEGNFTIHFVNCDHGAGAPDAVGVIVEVDGKRIFEAGDTCLRLDRVEEVNQFGPIDVMIAPINGAYGNLNEEDCSKLSAAVKPGLTIPCHYGMFASHGGLPGKFYDIMRNEYPDRKFLIMTQGERLTL